MVKRATLMQQAAGGELQIQLAIVQELVTAAIAWRQEHTRESILRLANATDEYIEKVGVDRY